MVDVTKELAIIHTGYDAHVEKNRGKGERNARLIRMDLEEDPENYCLMGYLGDCYCDTEEGREEAKRWYYKAIERMPREPRSMDGRSGDTFRKLLTLLQQEGDERELLRVYDMAVKMLPQESDFDYILGMFYADGGRNYARAIPYLERALSLVETYGNAGGSYLASGSIGQLWYLLALCHYNQGDLSKCLKYCTPLLQSDIYALPPTILFLNALKQGEETGQVTLEQILGLLDKMYPPADPKARIFLVLAARRANYKLLEAHLSARCTKEELACLPEETNENQV